MINTTKNEECKEEKKKEGDENREKGKVDYVKSENINENPKKEK